MNQRGQIPKCIIFKLQKQRKILGAVREKGLITYKRTTVKQQWISQQKPWKWHESFQMLKEKYCHPELFIPQECSSR